MLSMEGLPRTWPGREQLQVLGAVRRLLHRKARSFLRWLWVWRGVDQKTVWELGKVCRLLSSIPDAILTQIDFRASGRLGILQLPPWDFMNSHALPMSVNEDDLFSSYYGVLGMSSCCLCGTFLSFLCVLPIFILLFPSIYFTFPGTFLELLSCEGCRKVKLLLYLAEYILHLVNISKCKEFTQCWSALCSWGFPICGFDQLLSRKYLEKSLQVLFLAFFSTRYSLRVVYTALPLCKALPKI